MLLVGVATVYNDIPHDSTCYLYPGDHPFIRRKSYVYYARARIEPAKKLLEGTKQGLMIPQGAIDSGIFARICQGLLESRHTAPKIRQFFEAAK